MAEVHREPLPSGGLDEAAVPGRLQRKAILAKGGQYRVLRMEFVGPKKVAAAAHADGVTHGGSTLRRDQVVPPIALQKVRPLGDPDRAALPNLPRQSDQPHRCCVELLQEDAVEACRRKCLPHLHLYNILPAVAVVEEAGIKAAGVDVGGLAPRALNSLGGDKIVRGVDHDARRMVPDVRVGEPKPSIGVGQARRPYAARIGTTLEVELRHPIQHPPDQAPVHQVLGVVNLYPGEPFEGRGSNVVVLAHAANGRIGIETG